MGWLLFLSRLAFICGLCFAVSLSLLFYNWISEEGIVSTILVTGHLMGMVVVPFTLLCYVVVALWKRKLFSIVPRWLVVANIFFMLLLAAYIYLRNT